MIYSAIAIGNTQGLEEVVNIWNNIPLLIICAILFIAIPLYYLKKEKII